ncbi:MAG: TlpA family protein disulfide reductase [Chloracidobacterium sp.]|nr:TlpA family protein disulfide reductase [Chloracidobacterium sp.]
MKMLSSALVILIVVAGCFGQSNPSSKEVFRDSDGNLISNNEFVDIRMANFHYPDKTIVKKFDDGTTEFRLQKIPQEGMRAPDIAVRTIDGKVLDSDNLKGKVVVLHFWFIGCPVCHAHIPMLNKLKMRFAGIEDVVFVGMTGDPATEVRRYAARERLDYLHVADAKSVMDSFVFSGYPKNIVISKTGEIVYWRSTIKAWDKFESVIRAELAR